VNLILGLLTDVRQSARTLLRNPGFTAVAVLALAIGLGSNIAAFSAFDAVLARDLPVRNPEQLVALHWLRTNDAMVAAYSGYGRPGPGGTGLRTSFSPITFERFRTGSRTLSHVFAFAEQRAVSLASEGLTDAASAQVVSGNYYDALGVTAFRGRVLTEADDVAGSTPAAVLTFRYWQRRFAGDPTVVGRTVLVNGEAVAIVGITPAGFDGTLATETSDLTLPLAHARLFEPNGRPKPRSTWSLRIMGRLKPGALIEHVEPDLRPLFEASVRESWAIRPPTTPNPGRSSIPALRVVTGRQGPDGPRRDAMADLVVALAVGGAILLISCANVANLLLVRGLKRRQELAVRLALGASRRQIVRLLLSESAMLSLAGCACGVMFAYWGKNFLSWLPGSSARIVTTVIDTRVLIFALTLSVLATVLCGLTPALRATRTAQLGLEMKRRGWRRLTGRALILVQVAGSLVFLAAAALAVRSVHHLNTADPGFDADNLLVFRLSIQDRDAALARSPFDALSEAIGAVPGVAAATFAAMPLLANAEWTERVLAEGMNTPAEVHMQVVRTNFFQTIGIPLMSGRGFSSDDRRGSALVAVINARMARELFPGTQAVGRRFRLQTGPRQDPPIEVVGVVRDAKYSAVDLEAPATLYLAAAQMPSSSVSFQVRTAVEPAHLMPAIRDVVSRQMPGVALADFKTLRQQIEDVTARPRTVARITAIFSVVALLLASFGLYGVVSYDLSLRMTEFGIRVALGATPMGIVGLVVRDVLFLVGLGGALGAAAVIGAAPTVRQFLYGVSPLDPLALMAALTALTAAALIAALPVAFRAARLGARPRL
jgi:predicted permease